MVAPAIAGSVWTPARDVAGNVLAGNWVGLPLNTWFDVAGPVLNDVIETPHYTKYGGGDSSYSIISAWCGAAWDYASQKMFISGGGHTDSSACETGIYQLDAATLALSRIRNRDPMSVVQNWNASTLALVPSDTYQMPPTPLTNGVPGAVHTYHGLLWIPPATMGNVHGGIFYPGAAKAVYNIDTGNYSVCNWFDPTHDPMTWYDCASFIDGSALYGPVSYWSHWKFDLTQTQATDWSASSFGSFNRQAISSSKQSTVGSSTWGWLRERRESFSFSAAVKTRVRYGQALDAAAIDWTAYIDDITLTSADGSHADFNATNFAMNATLCAPGVVYDHAAQTIYILPNATDLPAYRITGLAGNTWTIEKMADSTKALRNNVNGTYGRVRMAMLGGKKVLLRVSSTTAPVQVMRIS